MHKSKGLILSFFVGLAFLIGLNLVPGRTLAAKQVDRIYGDDRIATAIEISKYGWQSAKTVIVARADNPSDALSAASLSSAEDAPILLTYTNSLPNTVVSEINRLGANKVILLGGTSAISAQVQNDLNNAGLPITVVRIQGNNRYETAANINIEAKSNMSSEGIIVNGYAVADALSASSHSSINHIPIYLATKTDIPMKLPSNIKTITIYGGENVIGKEVSDQLTSQGISVTRIAGNNRYETNIQAVDPSLKDNAIIVRGTSTSSDSEQYPDAVAGAGLAYKLNANIILSHPTTVIPEVADLLKNNRYPSIYVLGGESAISTDTINGLTDYPDSVVNKVFDYNIVASAMDPVKPVLYTLSDDDNSIKSYNYQTGESKSLNLPAKPEQIFLENNQIYVSLVDRDHSSYWWDADQTGAIAIIDPENLQLTKKINTNLDPFDIVVDKSGYIYVSGGSGQWTQIKSFSEATGQQVSTMSIRQQCYLQINPSNSKIYAIDTDTSPRNLYQYTIANGQFTGSKTDQYHGDYDLGDFSTITDIKMSPDGRYLFNNLSNVFNGDLVHVGALEVPYNDIAFDLANNRFYSGIEQYVFEHQYSDFTIDNQFSTNGTVIQLYHQNNKLLILTLLTTATTTGLQKYALETLDTP